MRCLRRRARSERREPPHSRAEQGAAAPAQVQDPVPEVPGPGRDALPLKPRAKFFLHIQISRFNTTSSGRCIDVCTRRGPESSPKGAGCRRRRLEVPAVRHLELVRAGPRNRGVTRAYLSHEAVSASSKPSDEVLAVPAAWVHALHLRGPAPLPKPRLRRVSAQRFRSMFEAAPVLGALLFRSGLTGFERRPQRQAALEPS